MAKPRHPFDVSLSSDQRKAIALWLSNEIENADAARSATVTEVDYWWQLYEQARTRRAIDLPWPDAADLTSFIACEKVDAIQARAMRTVWVTPIWTVEGWGDAADRAPFVEECHQYWAEEERLQTVLDKLLLNCLVEPRGMLEVYESSDRQTSRKQIAAKIQTDELTGAMLFDAKGQPQPVQQADGTYAEAGPDEPAVQMVMDSDEVIRTGPQYRVLPYRDSLVFPGHAQDKTEIWGYGKRIFSRVQELKAKAASGMYDADAVSQIPDTGDREPDPALTRSGTTITPQARTTAEKELWEVLVKLDLNAVLEEKQQETVTNGDGARWYIATLSVNQQVLLRFQHDDFGQSRYVLFNLFPRPDRAAEGFSLVGHKLLTTIEEHTAYRNMGADASAKAINAPVLKMQGALWDEEEQPLGPKQVVTVRDPREIVPLQFPDVPASVMAGIVRAEQAAERIAGVNDISAGQVSQETRTLGEVQMATEQSFVRMDLIVRRFQDGLEDVGQIRHVMYKRLLRDRPDGLEVPDSVLVGAEGRGCPIAEYLPTGKVTEALLDGAFRFRPYGSVETADPAKRRADVLQFAAFLPRMAQLYPMLAPQLLSPTAGRALLRQVLQAFRQQNVQAFLGSPSQDALGSGGVPFGMPALGAPMPGGMPPGLGAPGMMPGMMPGGLPMPGAGAMPPGPPGLPPMPQLPPPTLAPGPMGPQ